MTKLSSLAAISAAAFVFSGIAVAQTSSNDYDFNFAPMANTVQAGYPGSFIFSFGTSTTHWPGVGDAIRRCYSVDVTQGGRNETGNYDTTWFTFAQGFAANNTIPGVDVGLLSIQSATDSDLGGDACLSPWFSSVGNTGGHKVSVAVVLGLQGGTAGAAFPSVWQSVFQWSGGTTTVFPGVPGENVIGVDGAGLPLLANVIYEIQGPINSGSTNNQYYLGTTDELSGTGAASVVAGRGTGGVTNGNSNWGTSVFGGLTADASGAISHTRVFGFDPVAGTLTGGPSFWGNSVGSSEANGFVAFGTPFLWAENNGSIGAGGPDWNIGSGTPSQVQVWLKDIKSGAEGTADVLWKTGGGGAAGAAFDPNLLFNFGYFFWSATSAVTMQQLPMSWDDLGGAVAPKAGSYILMTATSREGTQSLPVNFDALTGAMLGLPGLSSGTTFTGADSVWYDAGPAGLQAIWEGMFDAVESGLSKLSVAGGAAFPVSPVANPGLAGKNIGVGGISVQIRLDPVVGAKVDIAEVGSALTLTLQ